LLLLLLLLPRNLNSMPPPPPAVSMQDAAMRNEAATNVWTGVMACRGSIAVTNSTVTDGQNGIFTPSGMACVMERGVPRGAIHPFVASTAAAASASSGCRASGQYSSTSSQPAANTYNFHRSLMRPPPAHNDTHFGTVWCLVAASSSSLLSVVDFVKNDVAF
jgi:hypothetical protein